MQLHLRTAPTVEQPTPGEAPCILLDWDSQFFGRRVASVRDHKLSSGSRGEIETWCERQQIDCLYFLTRFEDSETIQLAERAQFTLVDIRLTLVSDLPEPIETLVGVPVIRTSRQEDIPTLRRIARSSHTSSRFYFDSHFPRHLCDAIYETWIEKSCSGQADAVFVPEVDGQPAGYLSCHLGPNQTGNIGLVGLAAEARGRDVGTEMVRAAQRWFFERNVKKVTVVTQGRNVAAQRLYQRCGFGTQSVELWYHRWFSRESGSELLQNSI